MKNSMSLKYMVCAVNVGLRVAQRQPTQLARPTGLIPACIFVRILGAVRIYAGCILLLLMAQASQATLTNDSIPTSILKKIQCSPYIFHVRFVGMMNRMEIANSNPSINIIEVDKSVSFPVFEIIEVLKSGHETPSKGERYFGQGYQQEVIKYAIEKLKKKPDFISFFESKITGRGAIGQWQSNLPAGEEYESIEVISEIKKIHNSRIDGAKNCASNEMRALR